MSRRLRGTPDFSSTYLQLFAVVCSSSSGKPDSPNSFLCSIGPGIIQDGKSRYSEASQHNGARNASDETQQVNVHFHKLTRNRNNSFVSVHVQCTMCNSPYCQEEGLHDRHWLVLALCESFSLCHQFTSWRQEGFASWARTPTRSLSGVSLLSTTGQNLACQVRSHPNKKLLHVPV